MDDIVRRENLKETLGKILEVHEGQSTDSTSENEKASYINKDEFSPKSDVAHAGINPYLTAWERVQLSRKTDRPSGSDYIEALFTDFMEFHGDRNYGDDRAVIGGIAKFHGRPVTVIVQEKGTNTKENIAHNFGMPMPEGYRKALRLMKQAEKFHRPVICFVDTPGAFCGIEAEERGQGEAIACNLWELARTENAGSVHCNRRRRQRRCTCTCGRRSGMDAGKLRVFHSFTGRVRKHSLERQHQSQRSCSSYETDSI